jgi:hypothetical protein
MLPHQTLASLNLTNDILRELPESYRHLRTDNNVQLGVAGEGVAVDGMKLELRTGSVKESAGGESAGWHRWECLLLGVTSAGKGIRSVPHVDTPET